VELERRPDHWVGNQSNVAELAPNMAVQLSLLPFLVLSETVEMICTLPGDLLVDDGHDASRLVWRAWASAAVPRQRPPRIFQAPMQDTHACIIGKLVQGHCIAPPNAAGSQPCAEVLALCIESTTED
jgi:hypothetical protein